MRKLVFFIIILSVIGPLRGQTSYDVEYAQVCLIDSIAPDTVIQFWRFTQANNPGEYSVDMTFDLASSYTVEGTVLPCCSCLTEAMAANGGGGGGIGDIAMANPPPINALLLLSGAVLLALIIPRRKIAVLLILAAPAAATAQPGTTFDIEHTCICLVDSIAADTVIQFWRFTQSNNPGEYTVDVTFDLGSGYTVAGTVLSCKDYYLGDNPGGSGTANTLAMWTGTSSLGNSSVTQSGTILSSSFTGSFRVPTGTNAQEPVWAAGMIRYDTDDAAFEGYQGSEFFFAEAATNNLTSTSVLIADANGRITQDNANFYYSSDILKLGTTTSCRINPISGFDAASLSVSVGTTNSTPTSSVAIGGGANVAGYNGIAIGTSTVSGGNSGSWGNSVAIGHSASANSQYGTSIGTSSNANNVAATAIGYGAVASSTNGGVAIGSGAVANQPATTAVGGSSLASASSGSAFGNAAMASGSSSTAIGTRARAMNTNAIAIGDSTVTTAAFQFVAGTICVVGGVGDRGYIDNVYFGSGVTRGGKIGAGISYSINGSGANGTDQVGGNITLAGGKGTGTGTPGDIFFSTSTAGSTGTTLQTLTQRGVIKGETGQVGIGTVSPNASALLQLDSTTKGFLPPRMTTTQRNAIGSPETGLIIFNTTTTKLECYDGATWQAAW